jgi:signal transduction histidine kinase
MGQSALLREQIPGEGDTYAELVKLVSELAHEIRNPLSSIRLNMELLGEDIGSLGD